MIRHVRFLCLLLLISSCHSSSEQRDSQRPLRLNMYTEPQALDPALASDVPSFIVLKMLFEGLTRTAHNGEVELAQAKSFDLSEDKRTYTFHLRDSFWSDGKPVTADDFEYSWKRILSPLTPSPEAYHFFLIKNAQAAKEGKVSLDEVAIQALDAQTLVVELHRPAPYFLEMLCLSSYLPTPKHIAENDQDWALNAGPQYISNGPFTLDSWVHSSEIRLSNNAHYWEASKVSLPSIELQMIEDVNTELQLFEQGELDWAGKPISLGLPTDALEALHASGRLESIELSATYLFVINTTKPPFDNKKLRQALSYAIDRKKIIENICQGGETIATGIVPPVLSKRTTPYFSDNDTERAKALFEEALEELNLTHADLPTMTLAYNTGEVHHKIAQAIQQQWFDVLGFRAALEHLEWKIYLDKIQSKNYDIARITPVAQYNDQISLLELLRAPKDSINVTGWGHPQFKELLDQSAYMSNPEERRQLLWDAEELMMEEMPFIPMFYLNSPYMRHPKLKGVYIPPQATIDFKYAHFED